LAEDVARASCGKTVAFGLRMMKGSIKRIWISGDSWRQCYGRALIDCGVIHMSELLSAGIQDAPESLKMIIGNKETIAVELEVSNRGHYVMGFVRMWLNGRFLGSIEEEEMLSTYVHSLGWIGGMEDIGVDELDFGAAERKPWKQ
jgi:hypothetical protein